MSQLGRDAGDDAGAQLLRAIRDSRLARRDPALVGAFANAEETGLTSLRDGQLCIQPSENLLDRLVLGDGLALSQTGE